MKARQRGFEVFDPPAEYRLPSALDAEQKKLRDLQRENVELRNRRPRLALTVGDGADRLTMDVGEPPRLDEAKIRGQVEAARRDHRPLDRHDRARAQARARGRAKLGGAPVRHLVAGPEAYQNYNVALEKYFTSYEEYLRRLPEEEDQRRRVISVDLTVANTGNEPAESVDIVLHLPDGMHALEAPGPLPLPDPPRLPKKPRGAITHMMADLQETFAISDRGRLPNIDIPIPSPPPNVRGPWISLPPDDQVVRCHVRKLRHKEGATFATFSLNFESREAARNCEISYEVSADNIPEPITGVFHVIVIRGD